MNLHVAGMEVVMNDEWFTRHPDLFDCFLCDLSTFGKKTLALPRKKFAITSRQDSFFVPVEDSIVIQDIEVTTGLEGQ